MTLRDLKARTFGEKLKGKELEKLVRIFGENPEEVLYFDPVEEGAQKGIPRGIIILTPTQEGIQYSLSIERDDLYVDGQGNQRIDPTGYPKLVEGKVSYSVLGLGEIFSGERDEVGPVGGGGG